MASTDPSEPPVPTVPKLHGEQLVPAEEAEVRALVKIQRALAPLAAESRTRVLGWFSRSCARGLEASAVARSNSEFEDLSAVFEAADPKTEPERVLAACYYHVQACREPDVGARAISDELKQLGHAARHVSWTLRQLNVRDPALLMVASKNGSGRGSKYRYRMTSAGVKYVVEMLNRHAP